ncbi:hypothetical protein OG596_08835 [Streptomyces sp. NBC_01102]|nr:hypothetical protein OG596_08835 [Streptomyces sp. NBC_01102]
MGEEFLDGAVAFADGRDDSAGPAADVEHAVRFCRWLRFSGLVRGLVGCAEAAVVAGDGLLHGLGEVVPQVPGVGDLDGLRGGFPGGFRVGGGAVPADDLDLGVVGQPAGHRCGLAAGQHVDGPAGLQVDKQRGVGVSLEQGEVVDAQYPDGRRFGQRGGPQQP